MSKIVVAVATTTLFIDQQRIHVNIGDAWAAGSPVVTLHPDLFSDDETKALGLDIVAPQPEQPTRDEAPVEQKTAAPGEKSTARKPGRRGGLLGNLFE
jgi:hypothetical protein